MDDFRRQFGVMRRWLPLIAVFVLALGASAYVVTSAQTEVFEARSELIVQPGLNPDVGDMVVAEELAAQYANASRTRDASRAVIAELGLEDSTLEFAERRTVTAEPGSNVVEITARSEDPEEAVAIVSALIDQVIESSTVAADVDPSGPVDSYLQAIRVDIARTQAALDELLVVTELDAEQEAQLGALETRLATLQANYADLLPFSSSFARNQVAVLEAPELPTDAVEPRPAFWTMLTMTVAFMLATAFAFTFEYLGGRIHDRRDLELATDQPVLGEIVEHRGDVRGGPEKRLVVSRLPRSSSAEMYRRVRATVESSSGDVSSLLVTGCQPGDGKTAIVANLAVAYAEAGTSVLLVDGDLRDPGVHEYFGLSNERGVTTLVEFDLASVVRLAHPVRPRLSVLTAGPQVPNPAEVVASPAFRSLLERAVVEADLVIIDGPVMPTYSDSLTLAGLAQATVLVVAAGTRFNDVREVAGSLSDAQRVNVAGAILRGYTWRGHSRRDRAGQAAESAAASSMPQSSSGSPAPPPAPPAAHGPYAIRGTGEPADR